MKWVVGGFEIVKIVKSFRSQGEPVREQKYHKDTYAFEKQFRKDVKAPCKDFQEHENPFDDVQDNLIHLVSKWCTNG